MDNQHFEKKEARNDIVALATKIFVMINCILCRTIHTQISIKSDLYYMRNRSFKFLQNWLSNHMRSQILLDAQVLCPAKYAHLPFFN